MTVTSLKKIGLNSNCNIRCKHWITRVRPRRRRYGETNSPKILTAMVVRTARRYLQKTFWFIDNHTQTRWKQYHFSISRLVTSEILNFADIRKYKEAHKLASEEPSIHWKLLRPVALTVTPIQKPAVPSKLLVPLLSADSERNSCSMYWRSLLVMRGRKESRCWQAAWASYRVSREPSVQRQMLTSS